MPTSVQHVLHQTTLLIGLLWTWLSGIRKRSLRREKEIDKIFLNLRGATGTCPAGTTKFQQFTILLGIRCCCQASKARFSTKKNLLTQHFQLQVRMPHWIENVQSKKQTFCEFENHFVTNNFFIQQRLKPVIFTLNIPGIWCRENFLSRQTPEILSYQPLYGLLFTFRVGPDFNLLI